MSSRDPLKPDDLKIALATLPNWELKDRKIKRELKFQDFKEAFAFMSRVAEEAERRNHHPEWFNVYNRVVIELQTHETTSGKPAITIKDIELARFIDHVATE